MKYQRPLNDFIGEEFLGAVNFCTPDNEDALLMKFPSGYAVVYSIYECFPEPEITIFDDTNFKIVDLNHCCKAVLLKEGYISEDELEELEAAKRIQKEIDQRKKDLELLDYLNKKYPNQT